MPRIVRQKDIRDAGKHNLPVCDLLVGGFPCQDLSIAGKRGGLFKERSGLFFEFVRIATELRPTWLVIENVPGLLTSNRGRDFAVVLFSLEKSGYRCAWRVLDSQWFGVAQRRRRVFIVGHADIRCAGAVLFEPESGAGNPESVRKAGKDVAYSLDGRSGGASGKENQETLVAPPLLVGGRAQGAGSSYDNTPLVCTIPASTGGASSGMQPIVCATLLKGGRLDGETETFVRAATDPDRVRDSPGLPQGMDSRRYKQCGNAVTVPVIEWLGRRMVAVHEESEK